MANPEIRLFGVPQVLLDGTAASFDTRKALALLAYLVEARGPVSRDLLAGLLWPEASQERARASLRRALSVLGRALGAHLDADRSAVRLDAGALDVDVLRFRAAVAAVRHAEPSQVVPLLEEAAALQRGDFCEGLGVRDSAPFEEWQREVAEELRGHLAAVLQALVEHLAAAGRLDDALAAARRWSGLDPLHEPTHRWLIRLQAWLGQRGAAVRQYRECVRILDAELGVPPLEETTELYEAVCEDRLDPPPSAPARAFPTPVPGAGAYADADPGAPVRPAGAAPPVASVRTSTPLVGRDEELAALAAAWRSADADACLLAMEGPAGIGKSRLVAELTAIVVAEGGRVLTARAHEGEQGLPYGPFADVLRAAAADRDGRARLAAAGDAWLAEAARLAPHLAELRPGLPPPPAGDDPASRTRFLEAVSRLAEALVIGDAPGLLICEDLQWADAASLDLLGYLGRRLAGRRLALLVTWRSDELDGRAPLPLLDAAEDRGAGTPIPTRIRLEPLDEQEVALLATSAGGDGLGDRLHAATQGVPFFVVQYLSALRDAPAHEQAAVQDWPLPEGVRSLVARRLDTLGDVARQLASAAAVIGRPFDVDLLREVSGRSEEEVITGLEELLARGLCRTTGDGFGAEPLDLAHDAVRRVVLASTSQVRARLLHRRVADVLLGVGEPDPADAARIAVHAEAAGRTVHAAELHALAGAHAAATFAHAEAVRSYEAALALGHEEPARLHEAIGDVRTLQGRYRDAERAYEAAAASADGQGHALLEHKLGQLCHRRGEWARAEAHLATAAAMLPAGRRRAAVLADRAMTAHRAGRAEEAADLAAEALGDAGSAGDDHALAQVHNVLGVLASASDAEAAAIDHLTRSVALADGLGDVAAGVAARNNLALALHRAGRPGDAEPLLREALDACARTGDRHREAALRNNLADLLHAAGDGEGAMANLKEAVAIFADIGGEPRLGEAGIWQLTEW